MTPLDVLALLDLLDVLAPVARAEASRRFIEARRPSVRPEGPRRSIQTAAARLDPRAEVFPQRRPSLASDRGDSTSEATP